MTTESVWPAVNSLADVWSTSSIVEYFLSEHPAREENDSAITEALKNLQAGTGLLTEAPLSTAMWEALVTQNPLVQTNDSLLSYLRKIAPLGHAVESTLGWLRSRLPLYPKIPAPQMASRGFRRSEEYGKRMAWRSQLLGAGLESYPTPPMVVQQLGLDASAADAAAIALLEALTTSSEWMAYQEAAESLTGDDAAILKSAREDINVRLNPKRVDEYEDSRMERRHAFRMDTVKDVVETLTGNPREFADAFQTIDDLIDCVVVNVLGQLVVYGPPRLITPDNLELDGKYVSFTYAGDTIPTTGDLIRLDDPLVPGVVMVDGMSFGFIQDEGSSFSFTAERLPATNQAFEVAPPSS